MDNTVPKTSCLGLSCQGQVHGLILRLKWKAFHMGLRA